MKTWELIKEMGENGFYVEREEGIYDPIFFKVKIVNIAIWSNGTIHIDYESEKEVKEPCFPPRILVGEVILDLEYKKTFWLKADRSE